MSTAKTPDVWLEVTVVPSESGGPGTPATTRVSTRPMTKPAFIQGRVRPGSWQLSERALSDWKGNPEASTLTVEVEDTNGSFRALAESMGVSAYARVETSLKLLSEAGRFAGLAPRLLHRGVLARPPVPLPRRMARLEIVDLVGSQWFALDPEAALLKQLVSREHLEAGGIVNTPKESLGKAYPVFIGEHSDHGALNANGTSAEKGMLQVLDLGDLILTDTFTVDTVNQNIETVPPPTNVAAATVGTPGPETYVYSISAIFADGETRASDVAVVTDGPSVRDGSNYIHVAWDIPAGWETYYADKCIGYRICGRRTNPSTRYLDINRHALTGDGFPDWSTETASGEPLGREYNDDQDSDVEKEPAPPAVGTATVVTSTPGDPSTITTSTTWGVMCWALGYSELHDVFGSNVAEGTAPGRTLIDPDDPDLITPLSANWPHANPWVEVNGLRLSLFYVRGARLQQHREQSVSFAVNACGWTDTGDDTGTPITEASVGYAVVLNELVLKNGGEGYKTGAFWPLETYADGTQILDIAALAAFQALTVARIGGRGYQMHLYLGDAGITLRQAEQWFNTTFTCYTGQNDDGQRGVWAIDTTADPALAPTYRQRIEVKGALPEPTIAEDEVENRIYFHYDWDPDAQAWRGDIEKVEDADSQRLYGLRDAERRNSDGTPGFLQLRCTRDRTTALDGMNQRLFLNKVAPIYQPIPTSLIGLEQGIGTLLRLTHEDGFSVNGYVDWPFFVTRKGPFLNGPELVVLLTARDVFRVTLIGDEDT